MQEKAVPSFLGYFKTLSIGSAPGIGAATSVPADQVCKRIVQGQTRVRIDPFSPFGDETKKFPPNNKTSFCKILQNK